MTYIISELHGQYGGNLEVAEQMILQSKIGGANAVKVQLYDSMKLDNNHNGDFLSLSFEELKRLKKYADQLNIDFFASPFDEERLQWCLELDFPKLKIANLAFKSMPELCQKMIATGKFVLCSVGKDVIPNGRPFPEENVHFLYVEPTYPAMLEDVEMPDFTTSWLEGYSDHTIGITAASYALAHGAQIIEKHFTIDHSWQKTKEKAHACAMDMQQLQQLKGLARGYDLIRNKKLFQYES